MTIFRELGIEEGRDRINEEVVYNIVSVYNIINRIVSQFMTGYHLSSAKFNILLAVKHVGGDKGLSQRKISELLLVTTSNMTRMIDKLSCEEYVERIAQKGDRRVNRIKITKKGSAILDEIWPHYKEMVDGLINAHLSNNEKTVMNKMFDKLRRLKTA